LNRVQKFVASNTLAEPLPWQNSTLLKGDASEHVSALKEQRTQNLVIFGSGVLVRSLMRRELIDEFVLQIHPTILGRGRRLFEDGVPRTKLSLVKSQATATGVVIATYECAGAGTSV
jgi:dihydrofolate reductase